MARWMRDASKGVPAELHRYTTREWGRGDAGIRAWRTAALAWLNADPERRLPIGDQLDVMRETRLLLGRSWFGKRQG